MLRCRLPDPEQLFKDRAEPVEVEAVRNLEDNPAFRRLLLNLQHKAAKLSESPYSEKVTDKTPAVYVAIGARLMLKEIDDQLTVMRKTTDEQA